MFRLLLSTSAPIQPAWTYWLPPAIALAGLPVFAIWLLRTGVGRSAMRHCSRRKNRLDATHLAIILIAYGAVVLTGYSIFDPLLRQYRHWAVILDIAAKVTGGVACIWTGQRLFRARLVGFGLSRYRLGRSLWWGLAGMLGAYTLIVPTAWGNTKLVEYMVRAGWIQRPPIHPGLELLDKHPVLALVSTLVVAPICEELFFRGILQTFIRDLLRSRWIGITATSLIFASIHISQPQYLLPLFIFSMTLGYLFEKSGHLAARITAHLLLNSVTMLTELAKLHGV